MTAARLLTLLLAFYLPHYRQLPIFSQTAAGKVAGQAFWAIEAATTQSPVRLARKIAGADPVEQD